jgi:acyl-CoA thioesterase
MDKELREKLAERLNKVGDFNKYNGITVTRLDEGYCECEAAITQNSMNPQGMIHGGLIYTLCDVVCGVAAFSLGRVALTLIASISYMRPGKGQRLRAVGRCVKTGGTISFCRAEVFDGSGEIIAAGDISMFRTDTPTRSLFETAAEKTDG